MNGNFGMTLTEHLMSLTVETLKALATRLGLERPPVRKAELLRAIDTHLLKTMPQWLGTLKDNERLLLADLAHRQDGVDPQVFVSKYGCEFPSLATSSYGYDRKKNSPLSAMIAWIDSRYVLAEELRAGLQALLPPPEPLPAQGEDEIPAKLQIDTGRGGKPCKEGRTIHTFNGEATVFTELRRVLALAQAGKLRAAPKSGRPTTAAERLIAQALAASDLALEVEDEATRAGRWYESPGAVRAHAWAVIVQQCGWCKTTGERLALTKIGARLLDAGPRPEDLRQGLEKLLSDNAFDEFNRINHIRGQSGKGGRGLSRPADRRGVIVESLDQWPEGKWLSFAEAFRLVFAAGEGFTVSTDPWRLYISEAQYGSLGYDHVGDGLERQYLRAMLMETLATLGMVKIAYTYPHQLWPELGDAWGIDDMWYLGRYDGLLWVSLTELGAFCLGLREHYEPPAPAGRKLLRALPTLDLVVQDLGALSVAERTQIERWAEPRSEGVWRLDRGRILEQLEQGGTFDEMRRFLDTHAEGELPAAAQTFLTDIERGAGALVRCEEAILIEARDEHAALLIAHDARAGKLCRHAGGHWLVVPRRRERTFRAALREMGHILPPLGPPANEE